MYSIVMMYAISASTCFFGKQLVLYCSPLFISGIRTLIAGVLFLLYAWFTGRGRLSIKKFLLPCVGIGVYSFFLSNTFKFWALQYCSVSHVALISIIEPLFVSIMAYVMFRERMTVSTCFGMILCMASGLILTLTGNPIMSMYDLISIPSLFVCISMAASVYGALLMRKHIAYENALVSLVMGMSMASAGILALAVTMTEFSSCTVNTESVMPFAGNLIAMIMLSNIIGYALYGKLVSRYSAVMISCGSFARPIFTELYQWLLFNQSLSYELIGCTILLSIGLVILYRHESFAHQSKVSTMFEN